MNNITAIGRIVEPELEETKTGKRFIAFKLEVPVKIGYKGEEGNLIKWCTL
jgi:hypothetical protein